MQRNFRSSDASDCNIQRENTAEFYDGRESYFQRISKKQRGKQKKLMYSAFSFSGVKEMVIDFICREDLNITTLKEFFEVFIASIKK